MYLEPSRVRKDGKENELGENRNELTSKQTSDANLIKWNSVSISFGERPREKVAEKRFKPKKKTKERKEPNKIINSITTKSK